MGEAIVVHIIDFEENYMTPPLTPPHEMGRGWGGEFFLFRCIRIYQSLAPALRARAGCVQITQGGVGEGEKDCFLIITTIRAG
jgi:hypothetical protein